LTGFHSVFMYLFVFLQTEKNRIMSKIIIAIDGYSGCGKSTTAKIVAEKLRYAYIDSGAMYRAVTYFFIRHQVPFENTDAVISALEMIDIHFDYNPNTHKSETFLNGENVESNIRTMEVSDKVSEVSKIHEVREAMVGLQRKMGNVKGIVMDGRDIGTNVFPNAELKIFMCADILVRAKRRQEELAAKGEVVDLEAIIQNLEKRDLIDTTRAENPLRKADDAILLDSSQISIEQQTNYVVELAQKAIDKINICEQVLS
jgi:CMP/dCMP kinase